jgi:hypothetical protein
MNKKSLILFLFAIVVFTGKAQIPGNAVPNIDWINNYSQRPTTANAPTAIDADQNVYYTGYVDNGTNYDLIIQKTDSLGNVVFTYTYDYGSYDYGKAIRIDASQNVYATGYSYDPIAGTKDYITIKLNPTGSLTWANRWDNSGNDDEGADLRIDNSGNVFVTGTSSNGSNKNIVKRRQLIEYKFFQWSFWW